MASMSNSNMDGNLSMSVNRWLSNRFASQFIRNNPVFTRLWEQKKIIKGFGPLMVEPIRIPMPAASGPQFAGISDGYAAGTSQLSMTGQTGASYTMGEFTLNLSMEKYYVEMQGSPEVERVNYVQGVMEQGLDRFMMGIESMLWANEETANSAGTRAVFASLLTFMNGGTAATTADTAVPAERSAQLGLKAVVGASAASAVTLVGGIQRAAQGGGRWCPCVITESQALTVQVLADIIGAATVGRERPDLLIMPQALLSKIVALSSLGGTNGGQFFTNSRLADLGFDAYRFRGCDIVADDSCPTSHYINGLATTTANTILAINTKYLALRSPTMQPKIEDHDDQRPIIVKTMRWLGQLTSNNLGRVHCRHTNVTA